MLVRESIFLWAKGLQGGVGAGSVCYADSRLYMHGESGELALVDATPEGYRERGHFTPPDQPERGSPKRGLAQWLPTAGSTSAIPTFCGATTLSNEKRAVDR